MTIPIISTKLYIPPTRTRVVLRPRLIERLNEGLHSKLTLVSASAGFGKTTLVSEWLAGCELPAAWLSLDEGDNDQTRFLTYLIAALQTIAANIGEGVFAVLQSPQPPATETILTVLLNEISTIPHNFVLVLDDYHVIDAKTIDHALTFLLEHLPPQMHLVIITREDPNLSLARLRVRGQLTELRVADLCFTSFEATAFLNQVMDLNLSPEDITILETQTEGWIAGLQLAALSMQGHKDATRFIQSFTGSHHFVLDYLVEEVLQQQSESVQAFLLHTSILDRLCGPLCDAVLFDSSASGQEILTYLERANLFIVPLDNDRRWFRYHHLFADLLRQRVNQSIASSTGNEGKGVLAELHKRASVWFEENGLEIEAFHHAVAANDVERASRLVEGEGIPLHIRGGVTPVLNWLKSLPSVVLDARPSLWVMYASALVIAGQPTGIEQKFQAAEAALQGAKLDDKTNDLVGLIASGRATLALLVITGQPAAGEEQILQATEAALQGTDPDDKTNELVGLIAPIRATLAISQYQVETIIAQSLRALEYLHPDNLPVRTAATWMLGHAYQLKGDRAAAMQTYTDAISISQKIEHNIITIAATIGLGNVQEGENQLYLAAQTYRRVLQLAGDPPQPVACEAHLGLARIFYEWNDMKSAEQHAQESLQLAKQIENTDRFVSCEVFLARLKFAHGDMTGAAAIIAKADHFVRQHNYVYQMPEIAAVQVLTLLHQGNLAAAAHLAQTHEFPISQARVDLARGDTSEALAVLGPLQVQMEARDWKDEQLKVMVLQAVALYMHGEKDKALQMLAAALVQAEKGGFIRIFVDEGTLMAELLSEAASHGIMPGYIGKLLAVFVAEKRKSEDKSYQSPTPPAQPLIEPLSERELNILKLISQGLSNHEISERLFLALSTVKGHNRIIFDKLEVQRRTEAVARARELGLL
ncbi:LuxR C-terminal-related transcriptional regulator [Paenibacillus crassostreae]|uniref:Transcriptional regulator n=1 Tax=Paenibacillus crassostreae TaxID=1763538 RepID=A0A167G0F9_9BACL|nr:LuxR C-terminal-related transcriptional regulator [Paenibacillus crassostreae]AOZ93883.1 LuxR family transcriptional regulator [Paenibacillus crassostreae]OAB77085.1 transcriptional regulator [Paenibacillus crassostreae]